MLGLWHGYYITEFTLYPETLYPVSPVLKHEVRDFVSITMTQKASIYSNNLMQWNNSNKSSARPEQRRVEALTRGQSRPGAQNCLYRLSSKTNSDIASTVLGSTVLCSTLFWLPQNWFYKICVYRISSTNFSIYRIMFYKNKFYRNKLYTFLQSQD